MIPIERTHEFRGRYHVLGGALSPIDGVEPEDLRIAQLYRRIAAPRRRPRGRAGHQPDHDRRGDRAARRRRRCTSARRRSPSPGSPPACRSAATWSTRTRSPSAAPSPAAARSEGHPGDRAGERAVGAPDRHTGAAIAHGPSAECRGAEAPVGARGPAQHADDPPGCARRGRPRGERDEGADVGAVEPGGEAGLAAAGGRSPQPRAQLGAARAQVLDDGREALTEGEGRARDERGSTAKRRSGETLGAAGGPGPGGRRRDADDGQAARAWSARRSPGPCGRPRARAPGRSRPAARRAWPGAAGRR